MELREGDFYLHIKTGGVYYAMYRATIEADMTPAVVYRGETDGGRVWVRPIAEFCDGRFRRLETTRELDAAMDAKLKAKGWGASK